ncbi:MAG: DUF3110 domain-containing protein [Oscillatoriales cyanobacterium RM1_1_9]|nr:DUF3110 domain-containing protein [Oscillatoriales cyanobacterium SM2_3_0]NJO47541.1 DUF3110 domain-containing protein [Oscillatoriales cyanobacterium RM2_1_1]NJO71771.1 DUF3110 domain-containing protein [Oscillatoriales cyanobacterium RM1_1_9]
MRVYVLLFNAGTENEGIHTIQQGDRNTVLMFESEDDATRFSILLEAQDFPVPNVESIEEAEIQEFCRRVGYEYRFIPTGELEIPPENNVNQTDWSGDEDSRDGAQLDPPGEVVSDDLDMIRRRLEGLL